MSHTISMSTLSKNMGLSLILIMAISSLSLMVVKPATAQTVPAPPVPQFTVKFVNASYTVATTNLYTGESQPQQVINYYIEITISSQPFTYSSNGLQYQEYFNIRAKPHYAQNWTEVYPIENGTSKFNGGSGQNGDFSYAEYISSDNPIQSSTGGTSVTFYVIPTTFYGNPTFNGYQIQRYTSGGVDGTPYNETFLDQVPSGAQIDFQVQALIGHNSTMWYNRSPFYAGVGWYVPAVSYGTASNWSNIQTITIPTNSVSSQPNPIQSSTPSSTTAVPELTYCTLPIAAMFVILSTVALAIKKAGHRL